MLSTTDYSRGDVLLVRFVFTDAGESKRRPVVVVSAEAYQRGRQERIVMAITSNVRRVLIGDHVISDWREASLLFPSVATGIIRTTKQSSIERKLGSMSSRDIRAIEYNLRLCLGLA